MHFFSMTFGHDGLLLQIYCVSVVIYVSFTKKKKSIKSTEMNVFLEGEFCI